jgi:hypothetical protein
MPECAKPGVAGIPAKYLLDKLFFHNYIPQDFLKAQF